MNFTTLNSIRVQPSAHRVWVQYSEQVVAVIDPGHGIRALVRGVLDGGALIYWQGRLATATSFALEYGVALEEALRERGVRCVFATGETSDSLATAKVELNTGGGVQIVISLRLLWSPSAGERGFTVVVNGDPTLPFGWGVWSEMCRYLPCRSEPQIGLPQSPVRSEYHAQALDIGLGYITSPWDIQLIMEPYWKLRVTEGLARVVERYLGVISC